MYMYMYYTGVHVHVHVTINYMYYYYYHKSIQYSKVHVLIHVSEICINNNTCNPPPFVQVIFSPDYLMILRNMFTLM